MRIYRGTIVEVNCLLGLGFAKSDRGGLVHFGKSQIVNAPFGPDLVGQAVTYGIFKPPDGGRAATATDVRVGTNARRLKPVIRRGVKSTL